jgi:hypothetical protein
MHRQCASCAIVQRIGARMPLNQMQNFRCMIFLHSKFKSFAYINGKPAVQHAELFGKKDERQFEKSNRFNGNMMNFCWHTI